MCIRDSNKVTSSGEGDVQLRMNGVNAEIQDILVLRPEDHVPKDSDFKVIYGVEAYLVDDLKGVVTESRGQSLDQPYVVFDIETTGFSSVKNKIIEIGAVRVEEGKIVSRFSEFVNPKVPIPFKIEQLTGINDQMVMEAPEISEVLPRFLKFSEGAVMVAHNADFDMSFILENCRKLEMEREFTYVDTCLLYTSRCV